MPPDSCVAPTDRMYGDAAGQSGSVVFDVHDGSEAPCDPESPEATTIVIPISPTDASAAFVAITYADDDPDVPHAPALVTSHCVLSDQSYEMEKTDGSGVLSASTCCANSKIQSDSVLHRM